MGCALRSALLAALLCGVCACSPPQEDRDVTTLTLWHAYRAEEQAALTECVASFNASQDEIEVVAQKIPYQAFADKLTTAIPRDNGPDLFIFAHDRIGTWAEADIVEPISLWATQDILDGYIRSTVLSLVYKEAIYGLPLNFKSVALFYNRALVDVPPKTDVELVQKAAALTDRGAKRYGLAYIHSQLYFSAGFIHGFGGKILDSD